MVIRGGTETTLLLHGLSTIRPDKGRRCQILDVFYSREVAMPDCCNQRQGENLHDSSSAIAQTPTKELVRDHRGANCLHKLGSCRFSSEAE